jgi:predicted nucleic acid-binding protein
VILVDTSVWVDHLRSGNATLAGELEAGQVLVHPFVIGELACGTLRNRREVLTLLDRLPKRSSFWSVAR